MKSKKFINILYAGIIFVCSEYLYSGEYGAVLETMGDSSTVAITSKTNITGKKKNNDLRYSYYRSISVSAPINKASDLTEIATLDGLVNSFLLSFEVGGLNLLQKDFESSPVFDFKALGSIGYEEFTYLSPEINGKQHTEEMPWQAGLQVGYNPAFGDEVDARFVLGYLYQETYKDNSEVLRLGEFVSNGLQAFEKGPDGEPERVIKQIISFEVLVRTSSLPVLANGIGIAPKISHDFEADVLGINVPVYFLLDEGLKLTGGFQVGWRDDTDDFTAGVFVGTSFNIWK